MINTAHVLVEDLQLTITLSINKVQSTGGRVIFLSLAFLNFLLIVVGVTMTILEGTEALFIFIVPALLTYFLVRLYLWNTHGREIVIIRPDQLIKFNDFKYFKSLSDKGSFEEIKLFIIIGEDVIDGDFTDTIDAPVREDEQTEAKLAFILQKQQKELEVICSTLISYTDAERVMRSVKEYLGDI